MDKRLTLTALALLPLPLLAACGTESAGSGSTNVGSNASSGKDSNATKSAVTGIRWTVDSLTVDGKTEQAPESAYLKIADSGEVDGNYGCNGFGSTAAVEGDRIAFEQFMATEMACADVNMDFEESLASTLSSGELTAEKTDGTLTLTSEDGAVIELTEEKPADLYGTKWQVDALLDHDVAASLPEAADGKAWLTFDKKAKTVTGTLGCNEVSAEATVSEDRITLGNPRTTRRMCSDSLMTVERGLLDLFQGTVTYRIDHHSITLTSENNTGVSAVADK
ncbi:META domain-containing protein [Streptomyces sp. NPDC002643]